MINKISLIIVLILLVVVSLLYFGTDKSMPDEAVMSVSDDTIIQNSEIIPQDITQQFKKSMEREVVV